MTNHRYYYGRQIVEDAVITGYAHSLAGSITAIPNAGATRLIGYTTMADPVYTIAFNLSTTSTDLLVEVFEGISYTGGTPLPLVDWNRTIPQDASNLTSTAVIGPTATIVGSPFTQVRLISTNQVELDTGVIAAVPTIVKPNTSYILRVTNNGTQTSDFFFHLIQVRMISKYLKE